MRRLICLLSLPPTLLLAGCERSQSVLHPEGPAAAKLAHMSWLMIITFLVITAIMWVLIAIAATKRRGSLEFHEPIDAGGGQAWIAIGGLIIPGIILFVLFVLGLQLMASFPIDDPQKASLAPQIRIIGHQWWWQVDYLIGGVDEHFTTANEIHIPAGKPVTIELRSADVIHSFWVPNLHGKVDLFPDRTNFIRIQANQPGEYYGTCAEYCGEQHAHMRLLVIAQPPDEFQAWYRAQLAEGAQPSSANADAREGEQVFLSGPCANCHQVRGTTAGGHVAPDLTHIGSRQYIGANYFRNNNANLEAWITNAQSLKPDCGMPNLTEFSGTELRQLIAYLRQLQ
jgi:cytochrome c oxidase subunit 2